MKSGVELVKDLIEFFKDATKWTKGAVARDSDGKPVGPLSPKATSWDMYGRLYKINHDENNDFTQLHVAYKDIQKKLPPGTKNTDIEFANDKFDNATDMITFLNDGVDPSPKLPEYVGDVNAKNVWTKTDTSSLFKYALAPDFKRVNVNGDLFSFTAKTPINFTGEGPITVVNQLLINNVVTVSYTNNIATTTPTNYRIVAADLGKVLSFKEIGTNAFGSTPGLNITDNPVDSAANFPYMFLSFGTFDGVGQFRVSISTSSYDKSPVIEYRFSYRNTETNEVKYFTTPGPGSHTITGIPPGTYIISAVEGTNSYGKTYSTRLSSGTTKVS